MEAVSTMFVIVCLRAVIKKNNNNQEIKKELIKEATFLFLLSCSQSPGGFVFPKVQRPVSSLNYVDEYQPGRRDAGKQITFEPAAPYSTGVWTNVAF